MYLDYENLFSNDQAITATAVSENVVALGPEAGDGAGRKVVVAVTADFATLTGLQIVLQTDDVEAMSGATDVLTTEVFPAAELVAGKLIEIPVPSMVMEAYARLNFVVSGPAATAGTVKAGIVLDTQTNG